MKFETFKREYDVIVCGAGVAGVAAALECARSGMKTALIEKTILPGGLATSGLINIYLPLCDGMGHQALFGITEELLKSSITYGPGKIPEGWRSGKNIEEPKRYRVVFSPASFVLAMDELMEISNLEIWYDTLVCAAIMKDGDRISGVEVENKSGRGIIKASCIIDATGDADIAIFAGAEYETGKNWLSIWAMQAARDGDGEPMLNIVRLGTTDLNNGEGSPDWYSPKEGIDGKIVSEFTIKNRKMLRLHYEELLKKNGENARNNVYPLSQLQKS
jgi:flavin-dependent dehydrogenase